jgi:hypothetical protein
MKLSSAGFLRLNRVASQIYFFQKHAPWREREGRREEWVALVRDLSAKLVKIGTSRKLNIKGMRKYEAMKITALSPCR